MNRYCIGIDLGTTNTVVAYVDTFIAHEDGEVSRLFLVDQQVGSDIRQKLPALPSSLLFHGDRWVAGQFASDQQQYTPERVVISSKSWLCHGGVNREAPILPWGSTEVPPEKLLSPVDAASWIVRHVKNAWNREYASGDGGFPLQEQDVIITVPASFDADAQELTLRAARAEGLKSVRLLEEPQAALYRWLERGAGGVERGTILVCDVGGGTTDLSLFDIALTDEGLPRITRLAVSDHILLGGDNIDAALGEKLASLFEERVGRGPAPSERVVLRALSRRLKEQVLSEGSELPHRLHVAVPTAGRSLFGGALSLEVTSSEVLESILEGFFPRCEPSVVPNLPKGGLRDVGLPYARDPRVTAHIAAFLRDRPVDAVLFNGGTLASKLTRTRILENITAWQQKPLTELVNVELDASVARGAAWYGFTLRQNRRKLILGGYPRSLYLELYREKRSDEARLLCVVPKGFSEPEAVRVETEGLSALVDRPVRFQLWSALSRPQDRIGEVVTLSEIEFKPLPPLATQLSAPDGKVRGLSDSRVEIELYASLSETGLCKLECRVPAGTDSPLGGCAWELRFNVRGEGERSALSESTVTSALAQRCIEEIDINFGRRKTGEPERSPKGLFKALEAASRKNRSDWDITFMRSLWPSLSRGIGRRSRSLEHEVSWFGIAGYVLRPGFGAPLDELRISEAWKISEAGLAFPKESAARAASVIFWRRIAGGLDSSQHNQLFGEMFRDARRVPSHFAELIRALASLERVGVAEKESFLHFILEKPILAKVDPSIVGWCLERLFTRQPAFGELDNIIPGSVLAKWLPLLAAIDQVKIQKNSLVKLYSCIAQRTADPRRDLPEGPRGDVVKKLRALGAPSDLLERIEIPAELTEKQVSHLLGDSLPSGIHVVEGPAA